MLILLFKMKRSVIIPRTGCMLLNQYFQKQIVLSIANQYGNTQKRKYSLMKKYQTNLLNSVVLYKILKPSKHLPLTCNRSIFSTKSEKSEDHTYLMNFKIQSSVSLSQILKCLYLSLFVLRKQEDFILTEFTQHSKYALTVVSKLIFKNDFSSLEGLLTETCRSEVQKNVAKLSMSQLNNIPVEDDEIILFAIGDINYKDEHPKCFEILSVFCIKKEIGDGRKIITYNVLFSKEFKSSSWIIKAINLRLE